MSYTEYLRRKAAAAPKIVDTTIRTDASTLTMRRRLAANYEFATGLRQGVINNVADPSQTGTTSNLKAAQMTTKISGGRVPDASLFTSFVGGQALDKDGGPFQKPQRYTLNSTTSGSLSGCCVPDEPAVALPAGTPLGTASSTTTLLSASGTTLTVGVAPYTVGFKQKNFAPTSITVSGAQSRIVINSISGTAPNMVFNVSSTAGLVASTTQVTITGATNSVNNVVNATIGAVVANTSFELNIVGGIAEVTTAAVATFVSPNNGTFTVTSVTSPTQVTVTNANAITDAVPTGTTTLSLVAKGGAANTVPAYASSVAMTAASCRYPSTEGHIQSELGPALFVDTTNTVKNYNLAQNKTIYQISQDCLQCGNNKTIGGTTCTFCIGAIHTHPADVPHNTRWVPRPLHGMGGIPVFNTPSPSDARKVGDRNPRNIPYVEKHHGNDLLVNPRRVPTEFVPTNRAPAHLKINDPHHYPVA